MRSSPDDSRAIDEAHAADEPHPEVRAVIDLLESMDAPSLTDLSPEEARAATEAMVRDSDIDVARVEDRRIDGPVGEIPIRIYDPAPERAADGAESRPTICYVHGGGWVVGSIDGADSTCRTLATETGYPVVSVGYRLAPEHPFPAGLEDCYTALEWTARNVDELGGDRDRLVVAGDSAGGNLATATALLTVRRGGPSVAYQVLVYPVTGDASETESYDAYGDGYLLSTAESEWFRNHYFERELDEWNVLAAPRLASDRLLSSLPPATVVTAGFDPLRDDGAAYADRLADADVPVTCRNYPDVIHGFFGMLEPPTELTVAHEAHADVAADLHGALE
ncbi:alpha/beta hydrolase [Halosolutus gelatinilyticus]|uniref:alpha/beta hydrolase n=1 Tax=Halosolutus gelatinilyticus TaxID=2931975 RepID=UPI001FF49F12|nr:alpha/beta hydrolase [Halosolutus gelatinilyticus]